MDELNPELADFFDADTGEVHHPLLITILVPSSVEAANEIFIRKSSDATEALKAGNWNDYVFLHERPYRLDALRRCIAGGISGSEYWKLVGDVWSDSENIFENLAGWREVWSSNERSRASCMNDEELQFLSSLVWPQNVWRGCIPSIDHSSLSWTLDLEVARWFAKKCAINGDKSVIVTGSVRSEDVLACFLRRNEAELVCRFVRISSVAQL
ncbi:MAG: hypothetical protein KF835_06180 [Xanthobacteraceae bacterium]|jgi:hypothetical protein|nr:hypothetical protein [Xanthobacteraceae bacterium]MBX3549262.1 hypothetical protein [Xanthobacteraceae bacterium]